MLSLILVLGESLARRAGVSYPFSMVGASTTVTTRRRRHSLGQSHCSTAFETNLNDYNVCDGMERNPNRFSIERLPLSHAVTIETAWHGRRIQFLGRECFHAYSGMNISCSRPAKPTGIAGGQRQKPPNPAFRTDYTFAKADATSSIDKDWPVVNAPHDFIAEYGNFTNDISNFKQGYLPRNASCT